MQFARIKSYRKDEITKDVILTANATDENGKPLAPLEMSSDGSGQIRETEIEIRLSQEALQKLIHEELPTEEQRIQELLDKIHQLRVNRILTIEKMDDAIEKIKKDAEKDFDACTNKLDIAKKAQIYKTLLLASAQKRLLSKFAIQEESELSLQLTKLRQSAS